MYIYEKNYIEYYYNIQEVRNKYNIFLPILIYQQHITCKSLPIAPDISIGLVIIISDVLVFICKHYREYGNISAYVINMSGEVLVQLPLHS